MAKKKFPKIHTIDYYDWKLDKVFNTKNKAWNYVESGDGYQRVEEINGKFAVYSGPLHKKRKRQRFPIRRPMFGEFRTFNREKYLYVGYKFTKGLANRIAKEKRKMGYKVRIIPYKPNNRSRIAYKIYVKG